jgi:hypothetical protein
MTTPATAAVQTGIEVAGSAAFNPIQQDTNPYEVRWAFQMGCREMWLNARECGLPLAPFGEFFPVKSFNRPNEHHSIDWTQPKEIVTLYPAASAEGFLMESLGGAGAQNQTNWGLKTAFLGITDAGKMAVINAVLLPKLSQIREIQSQLNLGNVLDAMCPGEDPFDANPRETCVSCWWTWLNSPIIKQHIANCAGQIYQVNYRDDATGEFEPRQLQVSVAEFNTALGIILESGAIGIKTLEQKWSVIASEYAATGREHKEISNFDHEIRKDMHQPRPQDRQIELAREMGRSFGGGNGGNANGGGNDALMERLVESTIDTNKRMAVLAENVAEIRQHVIPVEGAVPEPLTATSTDTGSATALSSDETQDPAPPLGDGNNGNLAPAAQQMEAAKNAKKKN